jgi:hypothetical protein
MFSKVAMELIRAGAQDVGGIVAFNRSPLMLEKDAMEDIFGWSETQRLLSLREKPELPPPVQSPQPQRRPWMLKWFKAQ